MKTSKEIKIILELSAGEASWLRRLVQNYLGDGVETPSEEKIRAELFDKLSEELPENWRR